MLIGEMSCSGCGEEDNGSVLELESFDSGLQLSENWYNTTDNSNAMEELSSCQCNWKFAAYTLPRTEQLQIRGYFWEVLMEKFSGMGHPHSFDGRVEMHRRMQIILQVGRLLCFVPAV
jgi:hypothetical protein